MKFSLCIPALYRDTEMAYAFKEISALGFDTVECWRLPPEGTQTMADELKKYRMTLSAFCPDYFVLNDPAVRRRYLSGLERAIDAAGRLHCTQLITQVGQDNGQPRALQHRAIVDGLKEAVPMLDAAGMMLLIEPLNSVKDHPGYYLTSSSEGFDISSEVNSPCVRILYDVYHQLHMGEDVQKEILTHKNLIGHFHIAGYPNRDERLFEGYDYGPILSVMRDCVPQAPIGVELFPSSPEARMNLLKILQCQFLKS